MPDNGFDTLIEELLQGPCMVADILPEQVPAEAGGQYAAVEQYYLQPKRLKKLRRKFARILLALNCYADMCVSWDAGEHWERNPDPETFVKKILRFSGHDYLRVIFEADKVMIDLDHTDTYMTVYDPGHRFTERIGRLAAAEGLFLWAPLATQPPSQRMSAPVR